MFIKELAWLASSRRDLTKFPKAVRQELGYAMYEVQKGGFYCKTKAFKGVGLGVYEVAISFNSDAYRLIYYFGSDEVVYIVHCFKKKSKRGIKTSKEEVQVIKKRLKLLRLVTKEVK